MPRITGLNTLLITMITSFTLLSCNAQGTGDPGGKVLPGAITSAGQMTVARSVHTATLLKNGKVLIAGGMQRDNVYLDTAELYDPQTGAFAPTGKMNAKRV